MFPLEPVWVGFPKIRMEGGEGGDVFVKCREFRRRDTLNQSGVQNQ